MCEQIKNLIEQIVQNKELKDDMYAYKGTGYDIEQYINSIFTFVPYYRGYYISRGNIKISSGKVPSKYVIGQSYKGANNLMQLTGMECSAKIQQYSNPGSEAKYWFLEKFGIYYAGEGKRRVRFMKKYGRDIYVDEIKHIPMPDAKQIFIVTTSSNKPKPRNSFLLIEFNNNEYLYPIYHKITIDFIKAYWNKNSVDKMANIRDISILKANLPFFKRLILKYKIYKKLKTLTHKQNIEMEDFLKFKVLSE